MAYTGKAHVIVSGRVQGVFYRANTRDKARELGLTGWVRNTSDGRVEAVFQGEKEKLKQMIKWCHRGPGYAKVSDVKVDYLKPEGDLENFIIRYG
ncbi:MAG: acylphosphatase [Candidatus Altiarchaeales archaeon ex4484_96]|nr:MAG: acylphosphatase [Candidatus Altiarchaeales archaeon ex4484_96]